MDAIIFLAKFWGWFMLIIAVIYLVGRESFFAQLLKLHEDKGFIFLTGCILLILGLITIILHNVWQADWRIIITFIGWASLLKGISRIGFPEYTQKLIKVFFKKKIILFRVAMVLVGLLGIWLIYIS